MFLRKKGLLYHRTYLNIRCEAMADAKLTMALLSKLAFMTADSKGFTIGTEKTTLDKISTKMDDVSHVVLCRDRIYLVKKDSVKDRAVPDFTKDSMDITDNVKGTWDDYGYVILTQDGAALYPRDSDSPPYPIKNEGDASWTWEQISGILITEEGVEIKEPAKEEDVETPDKDEAGTPKSDDERAMAHFKLSQEDWDKLSDDEKKAKISELPPKGTGSEDSPNTADGVFRIGGSPAPSWESLSENMKGEFGTEEIYSKFAEVFSKIVPSVMEENEEESHTGTVPVQTVPGPDITLNAADEKLVEQLAAEKVEGILKLITKVEELSTGKDQDAFINATWALQDLIWSWRGDLDVVMAMAMADSVKTAIDKAKTTLDSVKGVRKMGNDSTKPKLMFRDRIKTDGKFTEDADGNLVFKDATLFMPMVQTYHIDGKDVRVLKDKAELAMAVKFADGYVTDDHPMLGYVDNPGQIKGSATDSRINDAGGIDQTITIEDEDLKKKIKDGKTDLSGGFQADLIWETGEFEGDAYDAIQKNILVDHTAVVDTGRCSGEDGCGIRVFDSVDTAADGADLKKLKTQIDSLKKDSDTQIHALETELKTPVVDSILGISDKKTREDLMKMDRKELTDLLEMVRDGKSADDDLGTRKNVGDTRQSVDDAYNKVTTK